MMTGKIFSPGKLMLTSEYFAIDGALVLAVPTKPGQELFFEEIDDTQSNIIWEAFHQEKPWLRAEINYKNWKIVETNIPESAEFIVKVLQNIQHHSEIKFKNANSYRFKTNLQFPADFGLGSSSTLINNLAEWSHVDPFYLNEISLGGSGYDIAVAREKSAVLFQNKPTIKVEAIHYAPKFSEELIFIHLNQKQNSREGIKAYLEKQKSEHLIQDFTELTQEIVKCEDLEKFSQLMEVHEQKVAKFLEIETVKEKYFENCPVFVKSLGAWGGDFVMSRKFSGYEEYFSGKGFSTVFLWNELVN